MSTLEALSNYKGGITCASNWPTEKRREAYEKAFNAVPDLCYEIQFLQAERDELRATVARVEALADKWEASLAGTPPFKSGTRHYLKRLRKALAGDQP